jgi:hypothetical protein
VHCDDGVTLWSKDYHPFIDAMAMHSSPSSPSPSLLVLSSQSRQFLVYDAFTGKLSDSTRLYDSISCRSSMAVSNDGSVAVIQERDDTFGHSKIAAYRLPQRVHSHSTHSLVTAYPHSPLLIQPLITIVLLVR